jgi:hypothetical protein
MTLPTGQISFSDLRKTIGPNDANSISLGQCRPSYPPAYGNGITGVSDTNIAMSQFQGKSKLKSGFTYRIFKGSEYTFTAGSGGGGGGEEYGNSFDYEAGVFNPYIIYNGGGGGGGILVNGGGAAGGNGERGGGGGIGYGAGGGGGGIDYRDGGGGANGFVYLYLNNSESFFTSNTNYSCNSSGTLKFIMIGGGSAGDMGYWDTNYYGGIGGASGNLNYGNIPVTSGTIITIIVDGFRGTTSIVVNGVPYSAAGGGGGCAAGGGRSGGGGNAGTGHQGLAYFNAAITSIPIMGGYFADNPAIFSTWTEQYIGSTTDMTDINKATGGIVPNDSSWSVYSVEWFGYFYATVTDTYTFYAVSDDSSYVWIGSSALSGYTTTNCLINNGNLHGATEVSKTINLTKGTYYPIRCQFGENYGGDNFTFSFSTTTIPRTYNMSGYVFYSKGSSSIFPVESVRTLKALFPDIIIGATHYILVNGVATATIIT